MKNKQLRKFISLFNCLSLADAILQGVYDHVPERMPEAMALLNIAYGKIVKTISGSPEKFIYKVYDEINENLYRYESNRTEYIKDLLEELSKIIPFIDQEGKFKDGSLPDGTFCYGATNRLLISYDKNHEKVIQTVVESYVIACRVLYDLFQRILRHRCTRFKIDLTEIENEFYDYLMGDGSPEDQEKLLPDESGLKQIQNEKQTLSKALPVHPSGNVTVKSFTDWLEHDQPAKLAEICKKIFNQKQSPKEYAIMFVLLSKLGIIQIISGQRKSFLRAWYTFIGKPFKSSSSFNEITKYIDHKSISGYCFNGVTGDYNLLSQKFQESLTKISF